MKLIATSAAVFASVALAKSIKEDLTKHQRQELYALPKGKPRELYLKDVYAELKQKKKLRKDVNSLMDFADKAIAAMGEMREEMNQVENAIMSLAIQGFGPNDDPHTGSDHEFPEMDVDTFRSIVIDAAKNSQNYWETEQDIINHVERFVELQTVVNLNNDREYIFEDCFSFPFTAKGHCIDLPRFYGNNVRWEIVEAFAQEEIKTRSIQIAMSDGQDALEVGTCLMTFKEIEDSTYIPEGFTQLDKNNLLLEKYRETDQACYDRAMEIQDQIWDDIYDSADQRIKKEKADDQWMQQCWAENMKWWENERWDSWQHFVDHDAQCARATQWWIIDGAYRVLFEGFINGVGRAINYDFVKPE